MSDHTFTYRESGRYVRAVCSCGWTGDWRVAARPDIQRALHSDENAHYYAIKRAEEAAR